MTRKKDKLATIRIKYRGPLTVKRWNVLEAAKNPKGLA